MLWAQLCLLCSPGRTGDRGSLSGQEISTRVHSATSWLGEHPAWGGGVAGFSPALTQGDACPPQHW